jgi:hypothetical protein
MQATSNNNNNNNNNNVSASNVPEKSYGGYQGTINYHQPPEQHQQHQSPFLSATETTTI